MTPKRKEKKQKKKEEEELLTRDDFLSSRQTSSNSLLIHPTFRIGTRQSYTQSSTSTHELQLAVAELSSGNYPILLSLVRLILRKLILGTRCTHKNYFLLLKGTVLSFSLHCVVVADFGIRFGEQDPNAGKISLSSFVTVGAFFSACFTRFCLVILRAVL